MSKIGQTILRRRITGNLDRGCMRDVWNVQDTRLGCTVAITRTMAWLSNAFFDFK